MKLYLLDLEMGNRSILYSIRVHVRISSAHRFHSLICLVHIWFQLFSKRSRRLALEHARRAAASHPAGTHVVDHAQT